MSLLVTLQLKEASLEMVVCFFLVRDRSNGLILVREGVCKGIHLVTIMQHIGHVDSP